MHKHASAIGVGADLYAPYSSGRVREGRNVASAVRLSGHHWRVAGEDDGKRGNQQTEADGAGTHFQSLEGRSRSRFCCLEAEMWRCCIY